MRLLFALTLLVSSALLFLVQPLFAKMVLPLLGGTPAVWNTCMVFFQAALLAGYAYAHAAPAWLGRRRQVALHLGLLLLPLAVLPIAIPPGWTVPADPNPVAWLLGLLAVAVGLPFVAVAPSGPLLQSWFARSRQAAAQDPYPLYAASNLGSLLALLGYPLVLEPLLSLANQSRLWTAGYGVLVVLLAACAATVWREPGMPAGEQTAGRAAAPPAPRVPPVPWRMRFRWVVLAFVPSSLMLSVTTALTTDIAAIPLLWVIPLSLYLLTFVLVFAGRPPLPHGALVPILPLAVLVLAVVLFSQTTEPAWLVLPLHLLVFFVIAMVCHGELARLRPPAEHLTAFYLWLALGGVLGGCFNALAAPVLFRALVEYPLGLVLACMVRPPARGLAERPATGRGQKKREEVKRQGFAVRPGEAGREPVPPRLARAGWLAELGLGALPGALAALLAGSLRGLGLDEAGLGLGLLLGLPAVVCYTLARRRLAFALGIGGLLLVGALFQGGAGQVVRRERSFFGVYRVVLNPEGTQYELVHGTTVHGLQRPAEPREPLLYYHRTGPIGQVFAAFSGPAAKPRVGLIGLGAGSLAAYGEPGQHFTFYEIDPTVVRLASNYFTFLRDCRARVDVVVGDARLTLAREADRQFGLLVLDAFSSDAIPVHLLTREALAVYRAKLTDDGIVAVNVSNRFLNLEPVLGNLARDAGLRCWTRKDLVLSTDEQSSGKAPSQWVLLARRRADLGRLAQDRRWEEVRGRRDQTVWTDDFSNLVSVLRWE